MSTLLIVNLDTKQASASGTGNWTPPTFCFGETPAFALRFTGTVAGATVDKNPTIQWVKASFGTADQRPAGGAVRLHFGTDARSDGNTTVPLRFFAPVDSALVSSGVSADSHDRQMEREWTSGISALTAITAQYGALHLEYDDGSFLVQFGDGTHQVEIEAVENQLDPVSMVRVRQVQMPDGRWIQELRLIQVPLSLAEATANDAVLPPAPTVTRKVEGGSDGDYTWNEQQILYVPPTFRGAYQLKRGYTRTSVLSLDDGTDQIAAAVAVWGSSIDVTLSTNYHFLLEYKDNFKGESQPLPEVVVTDAPPGDITFVLPLGGAELAAALRAAATLTAPFEVRASLDTEGNGTFEEKVLFSINLTVKRSANFSELQIVRDLELLHRVSAKDYVQTTADQILVGQDFRRYVLGDGVLRAFDLPHQLGTLDIAAVRVRKNRANGAVFREGIDFTLACESENAATLTWLATTTPAVAGIVVILAAAGTVATFLAHTHTIDQINGLRLWMDAIGGNVETLMGLLPGTNPGVVTDTATAAATTITLPLKEEVLFYSGAIDLTKLSARGPYLLNAVHAAAAIDLPTPLPAPSANGLWKATAPALISTGGNIRSVTVPTNGYVGSNGRTNYQVSRAGTSASYYATAFERPLFEFAIGDREFRVGRTLDVQFAVGLQLINANTEAEYVLVIEQGAPTNVVAPDGADPENLKDVEWVYTPVVELPIVVTPLLRTHPVGCRIKRGVAAITADTMAYGAWSGANDRAPATANFVIRARLIKFDVKDTVADPRGWLYYKIGGVDDIASAGQATIS